METVKIVSDSSRYRSIHGEVYLCDMSDVVDPKISDCSILLHGVLYHFHGFRKTN